ncbi:MAG: PAS domain S-box protein [Flavobacteriales bacterium]
MDYSKKTKEELVKEITLLKQKEESFSLVLNKINEMFYKISIDKNEKKTIEYLSPQVEEIFGLSIEDYINNQHKLFEHFHPEELEKLKKEVELQKTAHIPKSITYRFYNKKKKKYVWVEETLVNIFSDNNQRIGIFGTAKDVSEKKEAEQSLKFILENINECIYNVKFTETEKVLTYISPQIENLLGLTIAEFNKEGKTGKIINRIHPDDISLINDNVKKGMYITKSPQINTVFRFKPKGGKDYLWIDETIHVKYNKQGDVLETTTVIRDVTKEKIQQQQIVENENRYNLLSSATNEVVIIHNQGTILEVNDAITKVFGYHPEELIGKSVLDLASDESKNVVIKNMKTNYSKPYEAIGIRKDGEKFYGEILAKQISWKGKKLRVATIRDITEKKVIEKHLKQNEERYRQLFTKNMAGVFITENGVIVECNNAFAKIFGYRSRVELIGKKSEDLYFNKKDREYYLKDLRKKGGSLSNYKLRHKDKNNNEIWISTNVTLHERVENKKQKIKLEGTLIDITEQVLKEKQLKQSEQNYKNLIENSPYGIIIHVDGKIIFANQKAAQIVGYEDFSIEKSKKDIFEYLLPEHKVNTSKKRKEILKKGLDKFVDVKIKSPITNRVIELQTRALPIQYQNQNAIQVVFHDVSVQKQLARERLKNQIAEESNKLLQREIEERKKVEKELLQNQNYTNNLIYSSLDIICATDENDKIKEFNRAAESTFGYSKEEMKGKDPRILYADEISFLKTRKELEKNGYFIGEVQNKRKNGEIFTSFLSASVLYDKDEKIIGTMGVSRDITDIKLAENELIESEERYRDLFENASDLIQSVSVKGNIVYVNNAWKRTLDYTDDEMLGKTIFDLLHQDGKEHCLNFFKELIGSKNKKPVKTIIELKHKNGTKITVEGSVSCKFNTEGEIVSTRGIFRNITDEKWIATRQDVYNKVSKIIAEKTNAEEIYELIRQKLSDVMNTDIFAISYAINEHTIVFPYYYDVERGGQLTTTPRVYRKGINEFFLKQKKGKILKRKELDKLIAEGKCELIGPPAKVFVGVPLKVKNKVVGVLSVQSYHNENEYDEKTLEILEFISGALGLAVQKKYDEHLLFEQTSKLKSIIENSSHLFWTYDKNIGLTSFNQNYSDAVFDLYGFRPKLEPNTMNRVDEKSLQPFWDKKYEDAFNGKNVDFITERFNKNGTRIIREVFLNPIFDENNQVVLVSGIAHDITDKQIAEEKLKNSLKEKEILLKEVHHRVKNNLQVISSILNLQSTYVEDENTITILRESQDRIKTMSIIHESLYQANDFSQINFSQYIISLSKNLVHSYGILDKNIETIYNIGDVSLSLDLSIPCGLIINELISNALKYAFKGREKGKISISLLLENELVIIKVADDGVGIPKNFNIKETNTLGLQLVTTLVEQIDGDLKLENKKGTTFTITFKQNQ